MQHYYTTFNQSQNGSNIQIYVLETCFKDCYSDKLRVYHLIQKSQAQGESTQNIAETWM